MKKKYIIPTLDIIKAQMIGAICIGSEEKSPVDSSPTGGGPTNAAPKVV